MSDSIAMVKAELESLGLEPRVVLKSPRGTVVVFPYRVEVGSYEGTRIMVGLSFQGAERYPEYPPHWVHVTPPIDDGRGGAKCQYRDSEGNEWLALSRPPGPLWDALPTKHMTTYLSEHLRRFWNAI